MLSITLHYPSGEERAWSVRRVSTELAKLARANRDLGYGSLALSVLQDQPRAKSEAPKATRPRRVVQRRSYVRKPKVVEAKATRYKVDRQALKQAMKAKTFRAKAYADKVGAHEVTIYNLVRQLRKQKN